MTIQTNHKTLFVLKAADETELASLVYRTNDFSSAEIITDKTCRLRRNNTGEWKTTLKAHGVEKTIARVRVEPGTVISIRIDCRKKKYSFKKSASWKLRFTLLAKEGEELLTLVPSVNWQKESHDYVLQLNEEYEKECDPFLILQAVHCANLSMSMMTGDKVPALISI